MKFKIQIIYVQSKKIKSFEALDLLYLDKIKPFCDIELIVVKSEDLDRKNKEIKKQKESLKILEKIKSDDLVILCDENGEEPKSEVFAVDLMKSLELHKKVILIIGGAFGVSDDLKQRAQKTIKLSQFVLNHHIAKIVLLEQIYRSFTLAKGIPYHNE